MKILLINPPLFKFINSTPQETMLEKDDPMPPLGLMYLAGYLEKNSNHQVKILDCLIEKMDYTQLGRAVLEENPDIVGITVLTFTLPAVLETIKTVKRANSKIRIILGGAHVHIYPQESMEMKGVDFCVLGEGEKPLKELLDNLDNVEALYRTKGVVFRDGDKIINTGPQPFIQDLDSLPFPARHLVPYKKYTSVLATRFPVTTMITSRGCPFKCLFCDRPHMGNMFRARSANNVVDEIEACAKLGIKEIFIYDDTFSVDRQRVMDVCNEIIKRGIDMAWDIRTRVNTVDQEMLYLLKKAGCQRIHYGVEAGTEKILKVLRKGITIEQVEKAFAWTKKAKIQILAYFMIGSPTETKEDILQTIKLAQRLNPDYVTFGIVNPYPATDLYRMGLEQGVLPYDYWKEFAKNPSAGFRPYLHFWEKELSKEELSLLMKKAYRSFYFRPGYVLKRILEVRSPKELIIKTRAALNLLKI
jgi:anaerobic magnesium-protoporphyrin IX monomethyl ester cyclase